jgi:SAM-dependent methyltransferase
VSAALPLGEYALGIEGLALLRTAFSSNSTSRAARTTEISDLLDELRSGSGGALSTPVGTEFNLQAGYQHWSASYDGAGRLFPIEEPSMRALIDEVPPGSVLDAACGTGRYSMYIAERGHRVTGVDQSEDMLKIARVKLPQADFHLADLSALPVSDASVDAVVCGLALVHLPDLAPAMHEFARVLRPGGRLIISDVHAFLVLTGWQAQFATTGDEPGFMRMNCHLPSDYVAAASSAGLRLRSLAEPRLTAATVRTPAAQVVPEANRIAYVGLPGVSIWDFELPDAR